MEPQKAVRQKRPRTRLFFNPVSGTRGCFGRLGLHSRAKPPTWRNVGPRLVGGATSAAFCFLPSGPLAEGAFRRRARLEGPTPVEPRGTNRPTEACACARPTLPDIHRRTCLRSSSGLRRRGRGRARSWCSARRRHKRSGVAGDGGLGQGLRFPPS